MFERILYPTDFSDYAQEIWIGSTAENVVRNAKRPVLVIKV